KGSVLKERYAPWRSATTGLTTWTKTRHGAGQECGLGGRRDRATRSGAAAPLWRSDGSVKGWRSPRRDEKGRGMVEDGDKAPDFELPTDGGRTFKLSRLRGKPLVLYFYPKDDTSGCTAEAKDFSRLAEDFGAAGAEVIGVSPDGVESHQKFRRKY